MHPLSSVPWLDASRVFRAPSSYEPDLSGAHAQEALSLPLWPGFPAQVEQPPRSAFDHMTNIISFRPSTAARLPASLRPQSAAHPSSAELTAHLFGQLSAAEGEHIGVHLRSCRECRASRRAMGSYLQLANEVS